MLKKSLTLITLLCAMSPMVAFAASWSLATRVSTVGGTITSRNTATVQTSANGTVFKSYTTHANVPVTVTAAAGYAISSVSVNGVAQTIPYTGANPIQMGLTAFTGKGSQAVVVSFSAQTVLVPVTIKANPGGAVTPAGTFKVKQGSAASVTFQPNKGNTFTGVTPVAGVTFATTNVLDVNGNPTGAVKVSFTVLQGSGFTVTGNFSNDLAATASASAPTVLPGSPVTLTATASTTGSAPSFTWTQTGGPDLGTPTTPWTATGASVATPALYLPVTTPATTKAVYSFQVKATNNVGSTTAGVSVAVNASAVSVTTIEKVKNQCINCHNSAGVGVVNGINVVYQKWSSSKHEANNVACATCHVGADTGGHPGVTVTSATCESCHSATLSTTTHPVALTASKCLSCHDSHDPAAGIANLGPGARPSGRHFVHVRRDRHANGRWSESTGSGGRQRQRHALQSEADLRHRPVAT